MAKATVRRLATRLGLHGLRNYRLPLLSQPGGTGIRIEAATLSLFTRSKTVAAKLNPKVVRCRIRQSALVVELDPQTLARLTDRDRCPLTEAIIVLLKLAVPPPVTDIRYETYRVGSCSNLKMRAE